MVATEEISRRFLLESTPVLKKHTEEPTRRCQTQQSKRVKMLFNSPWD
jgi:hypothetical protein